MSNLNKIFEIAINKKASDIHLTNGAKPILRIDGELTSLNDFTVNTPDMLSQVVHKILNKQNFEKYKANKFIDTSMNYGDTRFRVHIYRQKGYDAIALRLIPNVIPSFSDLNLPLSLKKFTTTRNGLVLVTGVTGSGKSTTLAALIDEINENYKRHIITVEDPIEFIHKHKKSIINQKEVGVDVNNFSDAVKSAMREDPDILLVGEMRDLDTITNTITMAETGHLVFGTLHTRSVAETVDRIIDVFPSNQQKQIRIQLANSIKGIVSQELLPKIGGGRVPCCEILFVTDAIKNLIREGKNPNSILDQIQMTSRKMGSQTKIQALAKLTVNNLITKEIAMKNIGIKEKQHLDRMITAMSKH